MSYQSKGFFQKASDILSEKHRRFMDSDGFQYFLCRQKWIDFVGEVLAKESYISGATASTLYVQATNSVWIHQLTMMKEQILAKIQQDSFGKRFKDIRFRIGTKETKNKPKSTVDSINARRLLEKKICSTELSKEEKKWIEEWVAVHVSHDSLVPIFSQMMEDTLKKRKGQLKEGYHACVSCGTLIEPEKVCCDACIRKTSIKKRNQIISLLKKYMHYGYEMVSHVIPCSYREYAEAHEFVVLQCEEQIYNRVDIINNKRKLLSLLIHKPMEEITEQEAQEKFTQLREKKW